MREFSGLEVKKAAQKKHLPAGGYVAEILGAEEISYSWGDVILISFDICEGEHEDFFATDFRSQDREDKKWKGTYRLSIPKDDGSEKDGWTKRTFGNAIWSIEQSNPGYHFNWDERTFKGKKVGVLFRNREWEMDGRTGWTTECCALTSVSDVRDNLYTMPKDKPLPKQSSVFPVSDSGDSDLPF